MKPLTVILLLFRFLLKNQNSRKKIQPNLCGKQSGQALIVILAFSAILGAGLLSIYNTAQLTTAKRELVNAADASAYSGASIIAQGLNYTAYTNRAILANNALIGQMMAMRSTLSMSEWYWKTTKTEWEVIAAIFAIVPGLDELIFAAAEAAGMFSDFWGQAVVQPVKIFAEFLQVTGTGVIGLTNQVMWLSQQLILADSLAGFEPNMIKIAKDNAPNADVDPFLHATAFGPAVTLGMFASQFKTKVRKSERTLGTDKGPKDEYLNYLTEVNHAVATPAYLGGRSLLPNAIGLWIAKGCNVSLTSGLASAALSPATGLGGGMDSAVRVVEAFGAILGVVADPIMCLYERHGGNELVQLSDGKMAWVSIDAMAFRVPLVDWYIPVAGGATMSFTETKNGEYEKTVPSAVVKFKEYVEGKDIKKYMGHQSALPADCVEFLVPGRRGLMAVSTDTRTSGYCAVLATGFPNSSVDQGMWSGKLKDTVNKTIYSNVGFDQAGQMMTDLSQPIEDILNGAAAEVEAAMGSAAPPSADPGVALHQVPASASGEITPATTSLPDTAGLSAAGNGLRGWMSRMAGTSLTGLVGKLNPANYRFNPQQLWQAASAASPIPNGKDGGVNIFEKIFLEMIGMGSVVDMLTMKISNGVEKPRTESMNKIFNVLADGLPPYFWDVRITDKVQNAKPGEEEDLTFTDDKPDDYNERLYNLGPLVYLPLKQNIDKVKTAANLGIGGQVMGLSDYDEVKNRKDMRAIGKARIFFRQPSDHWSNRYKIRINASLTMPYWQVRNESLSYADKWGLIALDGFSSAYSTALSDNPVPNSPAR